MKFTDAKVTLLIDKINSKYKKKILYRGDEVPEVEHVPTGLQALDEIIGGGLPVGRLCMFYGPQSSGKTSISYRAMAPYTQRGENILFIDAEKTFDGDLAKLYGCDLNHVITLYPDYAEQAVEQMYLFALAGCPLIVVDSIPALIPKAVLENKDFEKDNAIGLLPRLISKRFPQLASVCHDTGTTIVFINQVRMKMNVGPYQDPFDMPGGMALKHIVSLIVQFSHKKWLDDDKIGLYAQQFRMRITKSKVGKPKGEAELAIVYDRGFANLDELPGVLDELRVAAGGRVKRKKKPVMIELGDDRTLVVEEEDDDEFAPEVIGQLLEEEEEELDGIA